MLLTWFAFSFFDWNIPAIYALRTHSYKNSYFQPATNFLRKKCGYFVFRNFLNVVIALLNIQNISLRYDWSVYMSTQSCWIHFHKFYIRQKKNEFRLQNTLLSKRVARSHRILVQKKIQYFIFLRNFSGRWPEVLEAQKRSFK